MEADKRSQQIEAILATYLLESELPDDYYSYITNMI